MVGFNLYFSGRCDMLFMSHGSSCLLKADEKKCSKLKELYLGGDSFSIAPRGGGC